MVHPVQEVLESLYAAGRCPRLHINALQVGVVLPDFVRDQWKERLVIDLDPSYPLDLEYGDDGMLASLSFAGTVTRCVFPWRAIYIVADRATGRGIKIEQNIPISLRSSAPVPGASSSDASAGRDAAARNPRAIRTTDGPPQSPRSFREGLSIVPELAPEAADEAPSLAGEIRGAPLRAHVEVPSSDESTSSASSRGRGRSQRDKSVRDKEARAAAAALSDPGEQQDSGAKLPPVFPTHDGESDLRQQDGEGKDERRVAAAADPPQEPLTTSGKSPATDAEIDAAPSRTKSRKRLTKLAPEATALQESEASGEQSESVAKSDLVGSSPSAETSKPSASEEPGFVSADATADANTRAKERRAAFRVISGGNDGSSR